MEEIIRVVAKNNALQKMKHSNPHPMLELLFSRTHVQGLYAASREIPKNVK